MNRYRPNACSGRGLEQCSRCLRFSERPEPYRTVIGPEVIDGRCIDHLEGRPFLSAIATTPQEPQP